ncbi:MAG: DUF1156 domain-containing protein [Planctomycetes bacterium]|nr:DUF1156 domain-containing protein [Planctomycetota bacterium]
MAGTSEPRERGIERCFDIAFVARMAQREKQIQQNYRPIIGVHKWFARRPGTLFRALLLAEFVGGDLVSEFFRAQNCPRRRVADPFMGGGITLLEANRIGCEVDGWDINPMAWWIVCQEFADLDVDEYLEAAEEVRAALDRSVGVYYRTRCEHCLQPDADVKYFLWVKTSRCRGCGTEVSLLPGYVVAENERHPRTVLVCGACGALTECDSRERPGACRKCRRELILEGAARRGSCPCPGCGAKVTYPDAAAGAPRHRIFAIEYHCRRCKQGHAGRFFKAPDEEDRGHLAQAVRRWETTTSRFVPEEEIPEGDESSRLRRWGYRHYRDLFNERQLLGLEELCKLVDRTAPGAIRNALATSVSDLLRYQNMVCRYDTAKLKSLDVFSVHGFPVGLVQCESNLLGIASGTNGAAVGSGGWGNVVEKYARAKRYCEAPFETDIRAGRKTVVPVPGERIGTLGVEPRSRRRIELHCGDASRAGLAPNSLDAVLTDPPYFANVQYAELMDFCYVWLRRLVARGNPAFAAASTRLAGDLTGNETSGRGLDQFTSGLSGVFRSMAQALKPGAPLAFTYHHNRLEAYVPVAIAILDSGLDCTAALPCPGEMAGSIHISGTDSSVLDTVFVCRKARRGRAVGKASEPGALAEALKNDLSALARGGLKITRGDARCLGYGHAIRMAVSSLRRGWKRGSAASAKGELVTRAASACGDIEGLVSELLPPRAAAADPEPRPAVLPPSVGQGARKGIKP